MMDTLTEKEFEKLRAFAQAVDRNFGKDKWDAIISIRLYQRELRVWRALNLKGAISMTKNIRNERTYDIHMTPVGHEYVETFKSFRRL